MFAELGDDEGWNVPLFEGLVDLPSLSPHGSLRSLPTLGGSSDRVDQLLGLPPRPAAQLQPPSQQAQLTPEGPATGPGRRYCSCLELDIHDELGRYAWLACGCSLCLSS